MDQADTASVNYSVKELLRDVREDQLKGFARLERGLETKADTSDLIARDAVIGDHGRRIGELEDYRASRSGAEEGAQAVFARHEAYKQWAVPTLLSAAYTLVVVLSVLHIL